MQPRLPHQHYYSDCICVRNLNCHITGDEATSKSGWEAMLLLNNLHVYKIFLHKASLQIPSTAGQLKGL